MKMKIKNIVVDTKDKKVKEKLKKIKGVKKDN